MLELKNIHVRFTAGDHTVDAVRGVSLSVARGEIYARLYELQYAGGRSNVDTDATDDGASAGS